MFAYLQALICRLPIFIYLFMYLSGRVELNFLSEDSAMSSIAQ